uniref:Fibronectin type III-like domain-containing protein n=2 Tax=Amorphochlora amoebiformis TaxID=1561963 RepID=A0A7S0H9J7_9EUKA|mmetsp:Transcript_8267/g.12915  ORF Transcript_8267/g.12915 Transcript_8267/m.12915 type:complete len:512 (+) Transcript_8267:39-1574(+)
MRTDWGATNALSFSDCGAVSETSTGYPWNVETDAEAAAIAIMNGTDIEAGSNTFSSLSASISSGRVTLARLKEAASRTLRHRFHLGLFDPPTQVEWTSIPPSALGAPEHRKLTLEAALQGLVLLRNDGLLPLKKGIKIAVLGPHSFTRRNLFSDYYGLETCWSGGHENKNLNFSCIKTTCQAISEANEPNSEPKDGVSEAKTGGKTTCHDGVQFIGGDDGGLSQSISLGLEADVVILALGTVGQFSLDMEHEGFDKDSISLPGLQEQFAYEILKLNKPTALVLINGSPLAIDNLLPVASGSKLNNLGVRVPDAIIEAFYPGARGGEAIAKALFGEYNAWGKLPMTIYPASYAEEVSLEEYDITKYPGRTYRYYGGKVLFEFGFGLSLSKFNINCEQKVGISLEEHSYTCQVENLGPYDGEEVVQLYHKAPSDLVGHVYHPVPIKRLIDFQRVFVKSGQSVEVKFDINLSQQLRVTDANGKKRMYGGLHRLLFTNGVVQATELEVRVDVGHR